MSGPPSVDDGAMAEKDRVLASLRVWIATAWADGTIAEAERGALGRMIDYATMPEAFKAQARAWLEAPVELEVGELGELSEERRVFIYSVAAALAKVDERVDSTELRLLERLREALRVDASAAAELDLGAI